MKRDDVRVGMRVRVRDWDDMMAEARSLPCSPEDDFQRVYSDRSIFCGDQTNLKFQEHFCFLPEMRELCGTEFVVSGIINGTCLCGLSKTLYNIEPWMVSPVFDEENVTFNSSINELFNLLGIEE